MPSLPSSRNTLWWGRASPSGWPCKSCPVPSLPSSMWVRQVTQWQNVIYLWMHASTEALISVCQLFCIVSGALHICHLAQQWRSVCYQRKTISPCRCRWESFLLLLSSGSIAKCLCMWVLWSGRDASAKAWHGKRRTECMILKGWTAYWEKHSRACTSWDRGGLNQHSRSRSRSR